MRHHKLQLFFSIGQLWMELHGENKSQKKSHLNHTENTFTGAEKEQNNLDFA